MHAVRQRGEAKELMPGGDDGRGAVLGLYKASRMTDASRELM